MNGAQDLGGMMGFGPVVAEKDEPVFHGEWEARVLANVIATQAIGWWSGDASRYAREISLAEALHPDEIAVYGRRATGAKYLVNPNKGLAA